LIALDSNVLIYAHRPDTAFQLQAYALIIKLAVGREPWGVPVFAVNEFLKVMTQRGPGRAPLSIADALKSISRVIASPSCNLFVPGPDYWRFLEDATVSGQAHGRLLYDAAIVAVCREHGARTIVSLDRDLRRFDGITVLDIDEALGA
jgi:toxin-antitoxin system PIN domain toxin